MKNILKGKIKHYLKDGIYYITDENDNVILKITLLDQSEFPGCALIETKDSVFEGPISLLNIE